MIAEKDNLEIMRNNLRSIEGDIAHFKKRLAASEEKYRELKHKIAAQEIFTSDNEIKGCGKMMYATEREANIHRREANALIQEENKKLRRAYFCDTCQAWHLTKRA